MAYGDNHSEVASDTFDSSIDGNWENGGGDWGAYEWVSGGHVQPDTDSVDCAMRRDNESFANNQYSILVNQNQGASGDWQSVTCRMKAGADESTYIGISETTGDEYAIYEVDSSQSFDELAATSTGWAQLSTGDTLTLEAEDTTLRLGDDRGTDTERLTTTDNTIASGDPGLQGYAAGAQSDIQVTAWEGGDIAVGPDVTASGAATIPAIVAAGVAKVHRGASGAANVPAVEAAGVAKVHRDASGGATLPSVEAAGVATVRKDASGGATLPPIEGAGVAKVRHLADGSPTLGPVEGSGVAKVHREGSGAATLPQVEAAGVAKAHRAASGDAVLPSVEAAGIATVRRSASGAASLPSIIAAGVAKVHRAASGAATLPAVVAAGLAAVEGTIVAAGDATLPAVESAGVAKVHRGASGDATLPSVEAAGVATVRKDASGGATLPAVEGSGVAQVRKAASGGASIPSPIAAGVAQVRHTAFGAVTLPSVVAAGVASSLNKIVDYENLIAREIAVSLEARYYGDIDLSASAFAVDLEAKK